MLFYLTAFILRSPRGEASLENTVQEALAQIEKKQYDRLLLDRGIRKENIRKYGFAFEGKQVLIGRDQRRQEIEIDRRGRCFR